MSLSLSPVHRRILRRKKTKMGKTKWWTKSKKKKKFVLDSFGDTRPVGKRDKLGLYFYNNYITMYTFGLSIPIFTSSPSLFWFCFSPLVDFDRFVIGLFPFFFIDIFFRWLHPHSMPLLLSLRLFYPNHIMFNGRLLATPTM